MINELLVPIALLIAVTFWSAIKHAIAVSQVRRQCEIARRGAACQGKVVAIQRPCMMDACTRLYFDFIPEGGEQPMRVCHIDRRSSDELRASLPATGAIVTVRYLPEWPQRAVIAKLVSTL